MISHDHNKCNQNKTLSQLSGILMAFLLFGCSAEKNQETALTKAHNLCQQGNSREAIGYYKRAIKEIPKNNLARTAQYELSVLYLGQKDFNNAQKSIYDFGNIYPEDTKNTELLRTLGDALVEAQDFGGAKKAYLQILLNKGLEERIRTKLQLDINHVSTLEKQKEMKDLVSTGMSYVQSNALDKAEAVLKTLQDKSSINEMRLIVQTGIKTIKIAIQDKMTEDRKSHWAYSWLNSTEEEIIAKFGSPDSIQTGDGYDRTYIYGKSYSEGYYTPRMTSFQDS